MKEVEYCIIYFDDDGYVALSWQKEAIEEIEKSKSLLKILGELGKRGWELVVSDLISISKTDGIDEEMLSSFILKRITREHVTAYR